jgi:hypothetical protein
MKRNTINFWIDTLTLAVFAGLAWTGCLIHYILPPRHGRAKGVEMLLWGWDRHDFGQVHFYLAISALVLILLHVWLHWAWVCSTIANLFDRSKAPYARRLLYGLIFLLLLTGGTAGSLIWVNTQVETIDREKGRRGHEDSEAHIEQLGQRSLQEISQISGVPVERFITELKLPADVDTTEQLGRLRRWFRFEMDDVRKVIDEYQEK